MFVRALKEKWHDLAATKSVDMAGPWHAMTLRSKGQILTKPNLE